MAQIINDADSPIVFANGASISDGTIYTGLHTYGTETVDNAVQVAASGGTLTGGGGLYFQSPFTGTGVLTLAFGSGSENFGEPNFDYLSVATFTNGFAFNGGQTNFNFGTSYINGPISVLTTSYISGGDGTNAGGIVFTSNSVTGSAAATLQTITKFPDLIFTGAGAGFQMNSRITGVQVLANTSGTQTFGGILGTVERVGLGGTSVLTNQATQLKIYGGDITLSGANGAVNASSPPGVLLQGGTLTLDNTLTNNNSRANSTIYYNGGNVTVLGVNGGATNEALVNPEFSVGLNVIQVTAGTGAGSSAAITFGGSTYVGTQDAGAVDFEGLGTNAHVFFSGESAGPLGPWATYNGTDFATYDTTKGVVAMSTSGRPTQVSAATASSYVLGTGPQTTLTADVTATGVTMNTGAPLDLGGHTLQFGGWIQNGAAGSITDGTLKAQSTALNTLYFTTNSNLNVSAALWTQAVIKDGAGTMTLSGASVGLDANPTYYVNAGTLALNVSSALGGAFVVGDSAGAANSDVLSLLADNQFYNQFNGVNVTLQSAGEFLMNGHNASAMALAVNGGTLDTGGGTLTVAGVLSAAATSAPGLIENGTINFTRYNGYVLVSNLGAADSLDISSRLVAPETLNKNGTGTLMLSNANNQIGNGTVGIVLTDGTVALANSGAAGSTNQSIQFQGGALRGDSTGTLVLSNPVQGGNVITLGSDITFAGGYTQTSYGGQFDVADTLTINGYNIGNGSNYASSFGTGTIVFAGTASGNATGTFTQQAGTIAFGSSQALPQNLTMDYVSGILKAVNGAQTVANGLTVSGDVTFDGSSALTFSAATGNKVDLSESSTSTRNFYVNGTGPITINNLSSNGRASLVTGGTGTLVLSGTPTTFTTTQVSGGTLRIKNSTGSASLGAVTVNSGGALGGVGAISGGLTTIQSGGALDPGNAANAVGTMNFQNGLTLNAGAVLDFGLGKTTGSDLITITGGTFTAPSSGKVTVDLFNSGDFGAGTFTLMSWNSSNAAIGDFALGTLISGYQENLLISGRNLELNVVAVPEPGTWALFALGGFVLACGGRRLSRA